ncbi:hypothetical protein DPMN_066238 [Dreissena polymorpha]|uniref:Neurotransmitter-gated ion-channel transmembrane domain-containing protein n=1 Tax=Dreissena polymorpha TaxID=45954 RepID=A0A9D4BUV4_DREPO|nr:hypothetical protein DPMN_066238 [Dreissena polymorpha]
MPLVLLSFLNVLTFVLPVLSGERASYAVTVFLSLAVFLVKVASEIPNISNTISIVSVNVTAMKALSTATVMTVLESRLASRVKDTDSIGSEYIKIYRLARICQRRIGKRHSANELKGIFSRFGKLTKLKKVVSDSQIFVLVRILVRKQYY